MICLFVWQNLHFSAPFHTRTVYFFEIKRLVSTYSVIASKVVSDQAKISHSEIVGFECTVFFDPNIRPQSLDKHSLPSQNSQRAPKMFERKSYHCQRGCRVPPFRVFFSKKEAHGFSIPFITVYGESQTTKPNPKHFHKRWEMPDEVEISQTLEFQKSHIFIFQYFKN